MIPLSLYIHIPWCEKKCPYCDFNSHLAKDNVDQSAYILALITDLGTDLERYKDSIQGRTIQSIFIGGGTPSLFDSDSFSKLLSQCREHIAFADDIEITLEANPGSSEVAKFKEFKDAGINRLSIGIQSFETKHLSALGRVHNSDEALNAARYARDAGFDNFNLDLMFGLPNQTLSQCLADLNQAIALKPTHLSCYQLTIEPNTLFHHHPPITPDDESLWEMQVALQNQLNISDYTQYEVSAYSQSNRQCRHNLNYWQFGDYLGIGAGAHGKITSAQGEVSRYWKIKHPATYLEKEHKIGGHNVIATDKLPFEFMLNALRLTDGFSHDLFTERTHLPIRAIQTIINEHQRQGMIDINGDWYIPTLRGKQMLDSLLQDYL